MKNLVDYDDDLDILTIRKPNEHTKHSINVKDICIMDINNKGKIVGLEFLDVAFSFGIPKTILNSLVDTKIDISYISKEKKLAISLFQMMFVYKIN